MSDVFKLPVHPAADVFPMLDKEELADLAADIKENGLQHPIVVGVVDGVTMLIDGRNRLAACKIAGVTPEVKQLGDQSPESLILSENIMRRHMTKGQRAMAVACMYPDKSQGKKSNLPKNLGCSDEYVNNARTVIQFSPEYTQPVLAGAKPLSEAYDEAKQRKNAGSNDTEKLQWLKDNAPDLADKVVEGELTLIGAIAEHKERQRQKEMERSALASNLREVHGLAATFQSEKNRSSVVSLLTTFAKDYEKATSHEVTEFFAALDLLQRGIESLKKELGV